MHMDVYTVIYMYLYVYISVCMCVCVCVCARVCMCVYVYMNIYIYIYTCIHTAQPGRTGSKGFSDEECSETAATRCNTLQQPCTTRRRRKTAVELVSLQHTATHRNTPQHIAIALHYAT